MLTPDPQSILAILSIVVLAFAAYITCDPRDQLLQYATAQMFLILRRRYIVNEYKDQINQNVVGDISFGRFSPTQTWPLPHLNPHRVLAFATIIFILFLLIFVLMVHPASVLPPINSSAFAE